jgi:Fumarylacetoacetate (FAA) hydrolase family
LVPKLAQASTDYEGELVSLELDLGLRFRTSTNELCQTIIIGKPARNIDEANALEFVAGYVVSNDVSCRQWQTDTAFGLGGGQWCFLKGVDTWAPMGPVVVSPEVLGTAHNIDLTTTVNGKTRRSSNTSDLLFCVKALVAFCSAYTPAGSYKHHEQINIRLHAIA